MARRLTEEQITKGVIAWLVTNNWQIVCFDFPQSGTGIILHPNSAYRESTKNKDSIIPDIIAVNGERAIFCENKDRFDPKDFDKLYETKSTDMYSDALSELLSDYKIKDISYGACGPDIVQFTKKAMARRQQVDFLITVNQELKISILYDSAATFKS